MGCGAKHAQVARNVKANPERKKKIDAQITGCGVDARGSSPVSGGGGNRHSLANEFEENR